MLQDTAIILESYIKLSYFWSIPNEWNALESSLRSTRDLNTFKMALQRKFSSLNLAKLYNHGIAQSSVTHARIRMGLSALNG